MVFCVHSCDGNGDTESLAFIVRAHYAEPPTKHPAKTSSGVMRLMLTSLVHTVKFSHFHRGLLWFRGLSSRRSKYSAFICGRECRTGACCGCGLWCSRISSHGLRHHHPHRHRQDSVIILMRAGATATFLPAKKTQKFKLRTMRIIVNISLILRYLFLNNYVI